MSNGIKFVFLLSVILIVMFSLTFAQDLPFNAEVIVESARMRWGPGPAYSVQHYAGLGHVLTILEADSESNPPWTWYYARTPSGVQSWIRGDLVRQATGAAAVVDLPTGTFPVVENNLCNDPIYRRCQDGTDHDLWTSGYWAHDRYHHWETGGWNLNVVYHNNPCKSDRLCTTREQWDAGALEAVPIAGSLTPEPTWTPVVIRQTVVGPRQLWQTLTGTTGDPVRLLHRTVDATELYDPPPEIKTGGATSSIIGGFRLNSESVSATCLYWYLTESDALVGPVRVGVNISRLPEDTAEDPEHVSQVRCFNSEIAEDDVVARKWEITLSRSYSGFGAISVHRWRLTATIGSEPPDVCTRTTCGTKATLTTAARTYLGLYRSGQTQPTASPPARAGIRIERDLGFITVSGVSCTRETHTQGESPNERTRLEYSCKDNPDNPTHELTFQYTHDESRPFVRPTTCPDTNDDGEPDCPG
ncbi:MAG: SH3 domain-containing protein [Chloroflexi bacterium]|nr:SH3 domain-containing protein [Chloroflexota bacterium]